MPAELAIHALTSNNADHAGVEPALPHLHYISLLSGGAVSIFGRF